MGVPLHSILEPEVRDLVSGFFRSDHKVPGEGIDADAVDAANIGNPTWCPVRRSHLRD